MSVRTTADEKREQLRTKLVLVRSQVSECQDIIQKMIALDTWGGDNWSQEFISEAINLSGFLAEVELELRFWKFFGR